MIKGESNQEIPFWSSTCSRQILWYMLLHISNIIPFHYQEKSRVPSSRFLKVIIWHLKKKIMILKRTSGFQFICVWLASCQSTVGLVSSELPMWLQWLETQLFSMKAETLTICGTLRKITQAMKTTRKRRSLIVLPGHKLYRYCHHLHLGFHNPISTAGPLFKREESLGQMQSCGVPWILQSFTQARERLLYSCIWNSLLLICWRNAQVRHGRRSEEDQIHSGGRRNSCSI